MHDGTCNLCVLHLQPPHQVVIQVDVIDLKLIRTTEHTTECVSQSVRAVRRNAQLCFRWYCVGSLMTQQRPCTPHPCSTLLSKAAWHCTLSGMNALQSEGCQCVCHICDRKLLLLQVSMPASGRLSISHPYPGAYVMHIVAYQFVRQADLALLAVYMKCVNTVFACNRSTQGLHAGCQQRVVSSMAPYILQVLQPLVICPAVCSH